MDVSILEPLVSVVIPIYNVEKFLDRCVSSVVNQTYRNLEIILVDDGSPDDCPAICDRWAREDLRIQVIHQSNTGQGIARNNGMLAATGKYICFFDSDDYVDKRLVEKCVASTQENDADVVLYGRWNVTADGQEKALPMSSEKILYHGDEVRNELLPALFTYGIGVGISAWSRMCRTALLKESGLRFLSEREVFSEDACYALQLFSCAQRVSVVLEHLYYYCENAVSFSRAYKPDTQVKIDRFLTTCIEYIDSAGLSYDISRYVTARYHMYTISALKKIMKADISESKRKNELKKSLSSPILSASLQWDVLRLEPMSLRVFFFALRIHAKPLCYLLLKYRMQRG